MALKEYVGSVVMELDSAEIDIASISAQENTGRRAVKIMNRARTIGGFARGVKTFDLKVTAVVPADGTTVDWANIEGAKITIDPESSAGQRISYLDCFTTEVGEEYQAEGEARVNISMVAVRKVAE